MNRSNGIAQVMEVEMDHLAARPQHPRRLGEGLLDGRRRHLVQEHRRRHEVEVAVGIIGVRRVHLAEADVVGLERRDLQAWRGQVDRVDLRTRKARGDRPRALAEPAAHVEHALGRWHLPLEGIGEAVVKIAMALAGERRGRARRALVDEACERIAPHAARMLVDVAAFVVARHFEIGCELDAPPRLRREPRLELAPCSCRCQGTRP